METSYPSQLALSTSSSSSPTASSNPGASCLSASTPPSPSTVDEPRHAATRSCDVTDREEDGCGAVGGSQSSEGGVEQGSSARPRTLLRRSRTTQQTRSGDKESSRLRRASEASFHESEWAQPIATRPAEGSFRSKGDSATPQWGNLERQTREGTASTSRAGGSRDAVANRQTPPSPSVCAVPTSPSGPALAESSDLCRSASLPSLPAFPPSPASTCCPVRDITTSTKTSCLPAPAFDSPCRTFCASPVVTAADGPPSSCRHRRSSSLPAVSLPSRRDSSPSTHALENPSRPYRSHLERDATRSPRQRDLSGPSSCTSSTRTKDAPSRSSDVVTPADLVKAHGANIARTGIQVSSALVSACITPPITRNTLRELDLQEVMRNAQLRHDVVFDPNLMFRPNFDGERGDRKRLAAEQYWVAVSREISHGCRCSTFADSSLLPCICVGSSTEGGSSISPSRLSSRIVPLVAELRGILLSLLPATLPTSPTPSSTAIFGAPSQASEAASFVPVYGPREQLIDALDPVKISQQLVQGVLDVAGLARFLGATLKTHCAPMRDELVNDMVSASEGQDGVVTALRMCFEILELMKLDIANHQLRSLRPYLLQTSVEFERRFFDGRHGRTAIPRSQSWIEHALESYAKGLHELPEDPRRVVDQIVAHGVLDSVFSPLAPVLPLAPTPPSSAPTRRSSLSTLLPETLQLDAFRFAHFHSDVTDLTIVYMLTLLYQQLSFPARPSPSEVDSLRHELWCIISSNTGFTSSLVDSPASVVGIPSGPAGQGSGKLEDPSWREAMQDAIFQVAARAQQTKLGGTASESTPPPPEKRLVSFVQGYFDAHAKPESKVFQLLTRRLRESLELCVRDQLAREKHRGDFEFLGWWSNPPGDITMRTGHRRVANAEGRATTGGIGSFAPSSAMMASASPEAFHRGAKRAHMNSDDGLGALDDDEVEGKRRKVGQSSSISVRHGQTWSGAASRFDSTLARNGLGALSNELKVLGSRIAKVTSFNLSVYRPVYESLLSEHRN